MMGKFVDLQIHGQIHKKIFIYLFHLSAELWYFGPQLALVMANLSVQQFLHQICKMTLTLVSNIVAQTQNSSSKMKNSKTLK